MGMNHLSLSRPAAASLFALACLGFAPAGGAPAPATGESASPPSSYVELFRRAKQAQLMREPARERAERMERAGAAERAAHTRGARERRSKRPPPAATLRGKRARPSANPEDFDRPLAASRALGASSGRSSRTSSGNRTLAFPPANVRINDPAGDPVGTGQAEQSLAADGANLLCAFNDGVGFTTMPHTATQGYAYSNDGGASFVDGGVPPAPTGWTWASDPVVTLDEKAHVFYYAGLCDSNFTDPVNTWNSIITVSATFPAAGPPLWGAPMIAIKSLSSVFLYDKEWMAADSTTHNLYLTYTRFDAIADNVFFQRSTNQGVTWTNPVQLSSGPEAGTVQGSRVAVGAGPLAPVYTTWFAFGPVDVDFYKVKKSSNGGLSWGAEITAVSAYHAWASGAPGFNRGTSIDYPSLAVDRTVGGAHSGRVYIGWHESLNYYGDTAYFAPPVPAGSQNEIEPNDTPAQASPFVLGQTLRGVLTDGDQDWYSFSGTQGQTAYFLVDSIDTSVENAFRLFATDGLTRLAFSDPGAGVGFGGQIVFTLPATGTYYIRPAAPPLSLSNGGYRLRTALHQTVVGPGAGRARDHRDVFVAHSDDGLTWTSAPVLVNDDPPYFDDWLPEVAVDANGVAYVEWFDWRDAPVSTCGGVSNTYLARSANGGAVWTTFGAVSDAASAWTSVASNISPNQGDYLALYANADGVYPAWADGRSGNADVYMVALGLSYLLTPVQAALVSAEATPDRVTLLWYESGERGAAVLERSEESGPWTALATLIPDGSGYLRYTDTAVTPGVRYHYRLSMIVGGAESFIGAVDVTVPPRARFALSGAWPNPTVRDLSVSFSLASDAPAELALLDVTGRRVRSLEVGPLGAGPHTALLRARDLAPGVYLIRLDQSGHTLTTRAAVIR